MISCNKGNVKLEGTVSRLYAELATIVHCLKESALEKGIEDKEADKDLLSAFESGLKTEQELNEELKKKIKQLDGLIPDLIMAGIAATLKANDKED